MEPLYSERMGKIIDQTPHTILFHQRGKAVPTLLSKRDVGQNQMENEAPKQQQKKTPPRQTTSTQPPKKTPPRQQTRRISQRRIVSKKTTPAPSPASPLTFPLKFDPKHRPMPSPPVEKKNSRKQSAPLKHPEPTVVQSSDEEEHVSAPVPQPANFDQPGPSTQLSPPPGFEDPNTAVVQPEAAPNTSCASPQVRRIHRTQKKPDRFGHNVMACAISEAPNPKEVKTESPKKPQSTNPTNQVNLIMSEPRRAKPSAITAAELEETIAIHERQLQEKLRPTTNPPAEKPTPVFNVPDAIEITPTFASEADLIAWLTR